mgnify:FL=1
MTLGVALCVRSNLGSSVISSLPYVLSLAGPVSFLPEWTIGHYTILMNFVQTNPDFPSEKRILSKQTTPFEAVKYCCPNKLNPRQSN